MWKATGHDLSFDEVKLNYRALIRTTEVALGKVRDELNHQLNVTYAIPSNPGDIHFASERIALLAEQLQVAAETYHALKEGLDRHTVTIVGK